MKLKTVPARFKAVGDDASTAGGEFEAVVAVFGNIDSWGDVVLPGAFADTIEQWASGPDTLPVLWSHRMDDPHFNIGEVTELREFNGGEQDLPEWVDPFVRENGGLWVKGRIDTGPDASPVAVQALRLLKSRRVTQFSFAYDEVDSGPVDVNGLEAWGLKKLKLYEVSPTQVGANELTELIAAKAGTMTRRKMLMTQDEADQMRAAIDALATALEAADIEGAPDGDDGDETPDEADEVPSAGVAGQLKRRRRAGRKAGRVLSQKNEDNIRQAVGLLQDTLKSLESSDDGDTEKAKREEPAGVKREEPARASTASIRLLHDLALAECGISD